MSIGIEQIEYYLPETSISSRELADIFGFPLNFIEEKIGVRQIYVSNENEFSSDLAVSATEKLFKLRPEIKGNIDVLIVCTQTPDFQLPHTSALVQKKLGLKKETACFDIGLGCSGFVYGLSIITSFMETNELEYGLLITSETYTKIIHDNDKNTKPLFSDGAAASLISRHPRFIPMRYTFGTNGYKYDKLIFDSRSRGSISQGKSLYMDGRGIYELVASELPGDIKKCLLLNKLKLEDIDVFVFHQASKFMLDTLSKRIGIEDNERVLNCIDSYGNTVSSSIPIALTTIFNKKLNDPKRKILISGFGVGLSWASTILKENGEY
jgi:3-oxoacyl-[acyl-carrier-protein] synthase-3